MMLSVRDSQGRSRQVYVDRGTKTHSVNVRTAENVDGVYEQQHYLKPREESWYEKFIDGSLEALIEAVRRQQYEDLQS